MIGITVIAIKIFVIIWVAVSLPIVIMELCYHKKHPDEISDNDD